MEDGLNSVPMLQTFRSIIVTNSENEKYEITSACAELSIYEDIFSNILTGSILYIDDHGGLSEIKFNGNEKITIELFKEADNEEVTTHDFFIYMIDENERIKDGTGSFILHFSSQEAQINKNTKCYSAIEGSCSQAVNKLFKYLASEKAISVEDTVGNYKFVMPSITPLECINWYAGRSISSESGGSYFLFFETLLDGFFYKCIDTLVREEPKMRYRYEPAGTSTLIKDVTNIREYNVLQTNNTLEGLDDHYTTLWNTDPLRKKIVKKTFSFDEDKVSTLNKGDLITASSKKNGFDLDMEDRRKAFGTKVLVRTEDRQTHTQTRNYYYESLQPKFSSMRQYNGLKLQMLVFGNRKLKVGDTVELTFNQTKMMDSSTKNESKDLTLSGKYLITAIRYIYKINNFDMAIEVVKDTRDVK